MIGGEIEVFLLAEDRRECIERRKRSHYVASPYSTGSKMIDKFNHKYALSNRRQGERRKE